MQSKYVKKAIICVSSLLFMLFAVLSVTAFIIGTNVSSKLQWAIVGTELGVLLAFSICLLSFKEQNNTVLTKSQIVRWFYENQRTATFLLLMLLVEGFAFCFVVFTRGYAFSSLLFLDKNDSFMDFYHSLCTARAPEGYLRGSIYPPISYIFFLFFGSFVPQEMFQNYNENYTQLDAAFAIRLTQEGRMVFMLFVISAIFLFILAVTWAKKGKSTQSKFLLSFVLLFSSPFLFAVERGNIILYSLIAVVVFIAFYQSENKWLRELALIALGFAIALKMIPVFFALLLLIDKRYKDIIRCAGYSLLLFILPFALFGGFGQIHIFLGNIFGLFKPSTATSGAVHDISLSFSGAFENIAILLFGRSFSFISKLAYCVIGVLLVCSFFAEGWKRALGVTLAVCSVTPTSGQYEWVYLIIPLILFLNDRKQKKKTDALYMFLFIVMFALFPNFSITNIGNIVLRSSEQIHNQTLSVFLQNFALLAMAALFVCEVIYEKFYTVTDRAKSMLIRARAKHALPLTDGQVLAACSAGMMALFVLMISLLNAVPFWQAGLYWLYQLFAIWLPGLALINILKIRPKHAVFRLGLGYAVGYALNIVYYIVCIPISYITDSWMIAIPVLNVLVAVLSVLYFVLHNRKNANEETDSLKKGELKFFVLLWGAVFLLYFLAQGIPNRLPGMGEQAYYQDALYWLGNALSLSRGFPPESMRGVGEIIHYHYFSSMQLVVINKTIGVPLQTLGLAFSYLQSATLIVFGYYTLFSCLFKSRIKTAVSFLILLCSMGIYEKTSMIFSSHMVTAPFGFDYGMGILAFALWLLCIWSKQWKWSLGGVIIYELLFAVCLGIKGPIGILLLLFQGVICLCALLNKKGIKYILKVIAFGVVTLAIFAVVYLTFMSKGLTWLNNSTATGTDVTAAATGGFKLSWEGTSRYANVLQQWYAPTNINRSVFFKIPLAIYILAKYLFFAHPFLSVMAGITFIRFLINIKKSTPIQWGALAVIFIAIFCSLFLSMVGYSQVYFIDVAYVFSLIFIFLLPKEQKRFNTPLVCKKICKGVAVLLVAVCVFSSFTFVLPCIAKGITTIATGKAAIPAKLNYGMMESNLVTPDEKLGYDWIKENSDDDSILITNATVYSSGPLKTNVFTERSMWVESAIATSVSREEGDFRVSIIRGFMEGDTGALAHLRNTDVDYVIILTRYYTGAECVSELDLVYSNPDISIYALS